MERVHFTVQILCFVSNNIYTCMTLDTPFRCVLFNMNHEMGPFQTERILFPGVVYIFYNPIFATSYSQNSKFYILLQVGLSGMAHSIQRELSTLATAVDTSKNKSFHFFLTGSYGIYGIFFVDDIVNLYIF